VAYIFIVTARIINRVIQNDSKHTTH
jgi:hypothetical protein